MRTTTTIVLMSLIYLLNACAAPETSSLRATVPINTLTPQPEASRQEARILGIIDFHADGTQGVLTAPATVQAGEEFQVTITTFGGGCEREGDTSVVITETAANVMVYDFTTATRPDVACTAILKRLPHTVTLSFTTPGEALIRVWGRRVGPETPPMGVPTILEQRVMVQ
jgi:predicted RNA-binding protein with TRAM domain